MAGEYANGPKQWCWGFELLESRRDCSDCGGFAANGNLYGYRNGPAPVVVYESEVQGVSHSQETSERSVRFSAHSRSGL